MSAQMYDLQTNFIHTGRKSQTDLPSFLTEFKRYSIFVVLCRLNLNLSMNSIEFKCGGWEKDTCLWSVKSVGKRKKEILVISSLLYTKILVISAVLYK